MKEKPSLKCVFTLGLIEDNLDIFIFRVYVCIFTLDWFHILDQKMLSQGKLSLFAHRNKEIGFFEEFYQIFQHCNKSGPNVEYWKTL